MEIRLLGTQDEEQSVALRNYNFQSPYTEQKAKEYHSLYEMADGIGAFDEKGKLLGQILNLPMAYSFYGQKMQTVGVNYVAVTPESRGKGVASKLMKKSILQAYERGQILSMLLPFSISFYRKFGFDLFTQRIQYRVPVDQFPPFRLKNTYTIERFLATDINEMQLNMIQKLYEENGMNENGTLLRTKKWWERHHYQHAFLNYALVWERGECLGYISYTIESTILRVIDFVSKTAEIEEELWNFLVAHRASISQIKGEITPATFIGYRFENPRIELTISRNTMVRIVDVEVFLKQWYRKFPSIDSFSFHLIDHQGPWNNGVYRVDGSNVCKQDQPPLTNHIVTVQELAAIFLGPLTTQQLKQQLALEKMAVLQPLIDSASQKQWANFLGDF